MKKLTPLLGLFLFISTLQAQKIRVSYTSNTYPGPFTGNVYLFLSKENRDPRSGNVGMESYPCFRIAVKNIKPGQSIQFDDAATSFPMPLSDIERGDYYVQAVWDRNLGGRAIGNTPGNIYNNAARLSFTKDLAKSYSIICTDTVARPVFKETKYTKEIRTSSSRLTNFYKRPTTIDAAVLLPKEYYDDPSRSFPTLYVASGYGGDYHGYSGYEEPTIHMDSTPVIKVFLDGSCSLGHSVYANSDNNGPWGDALTKDLIPAIEKQYRCNGARMLTGHSSGGWTVLWLQTHYPETFLACWSSSPDPVDFRSFQKVNLYESKNMYYGKDSVLNPVATIAGFWPIATQKQAYQMENVINRGEQMHSFDAVFSQRGADGMPRPVLNAATGMIDPITVEHWKKYDISLYLRTNWEMLKDKLAGRIRVSVGNGDNFLLDDAVHLLETEMTKLNAGFVFVYVPGDHFTIHTPEYRDAGYKFLEQKYNDYMKTQKRGF